MRCLSPFLTKNKIGEVKQVRCGYCLNCKRKRINDTMVRALGEVLYTDYSVFTTLTYDQEHYTYSLKKDDLQKFFKRLRRDIDYTIRYIACGEYGDRTGRAHYHAIIFGLHQDDVDLVQENWPYGMTKTDVFHVNRARYLAKYVLKSVNGSLEEKLYEDRQSPFLVQSQKLGYQFVLDNAERLKKDKLIRVGKFWISLPRKWNELLNIQYTKEDIAQFEQADNEFWLSRGADDTNIYDALNEFDMWIEKRRNDSTSSKKLQHAHNVLEIYRRGLERRSEVL